uniref:Uncharacterized protein n=1 Tax=Setaria italica TaxID=4555 RepID=K3YNK4_SETIT
MIEGNSLSRHANFWSLELYISSHPMDGLAFCELINNVKHNVCIKL